MTATLDKTEPTQSTCPEWCTDHRTDDFGGYSEHSHSFAITLPGWTGKVDVYGSRDLVPVSGRDPGPIAYVLEDDAQLSASELRALAAALLEAAVLMDSINTKDAA